MSEEREDASSRGRGPVLACGMAAALFGASTPAARELLQGFSPLALASLLYLGAAIGVAPWALRKNARKTPSQRSTAGIDRANGVRLGGAILFGGVLGPVLLLEGLSMSSAGSVSLWLNLETVATAVLARLYFKEHVGRNALISIALIVAASALLTPGSPSGGSAVLWVGAACVAWGLDNNFTSMIDRFSPAQVTFAKGLVAGLVNGGLAWATGAELPSLALVGSALGVGALAYGLSLVLYVGGAQQLGATRSQLVFSTAPAWGLLLSWIALGEPVHVLQVLAATMMAGAVWVWYREHHEHFHEHPAQVHEHWHCHDDGHHEHGHELPVSPGTWHCHEHAHAPLAHRHAHRPDLHHRHAH